MDKRKTFPYLARNEPHSTFNRKISAYFSTTGYLNNDENPHVGFFQKGGFDLAREPHFDAVRRTKSKDSFLNNTIFHKRARLHKIIVIFIYRKQQGRVRLKKNYLKIALDLLLALTFVQRMNPRVLGVDFKWGAIASVVVAIAIFAGEFNRFPKLIRLALAIFPQSHQLTIGTQAIHLSIKVRLTEISMVEMDLVST